MIRTKNSILKQAAILGIASIIVRAIGLLYRIPLSNIIGDLGNSYYGVAFNIYTILLLMSGYSIPTAVSKIISSYNALGEYRNAHKSFITSLVFIGIFGGILSISLYIFSPYFLPSGSEEALFALRSLSPTLFISGFIGVFQGYFQARRNTLPTALAQILEQVANAVASIFFAFILTRSVVGDNIKTASLGALGGTLGTLTGVIVSITILYLVYRLNSGKLYNLLRKDKSGVTSSYKSITLVLIALIVPIIFSTIITNIVGIIDQYLYYGISNSLNRDMVDISVKYGIYIGKYVPLANVPSALAYSVSVAVLPTISAALARKNKKEIHYRINEGITLTMLFCIPSAIGLFVLAKPIMDLLFSGTSSVGYISLKMGAIIIIITGYTTVLSGVLQGLGKPIITLYSGIISIISNIIILIPLLYFTRLDVYAIIIAIIPSTFLMGIYLYYNIKKYTGFKQNIIRTVMLPSLAGILMGIITWLVYLVTHFIFRFNFIALIITIPIGIISYSVIILKMNFFNVLELKSIPIGRLMFKLLKKLKLI